MNASPDSSIGEGQAIAERVERFVREVVIPYETDGRRDSHGPSDALAMEMRQKAREHRVLTPHILADGHHLSHRATALVLRAAGLSPLGPLAVNVAAPDEGNMLLLGAWPGQNKNAVFSTQSSPAGHDPPS